MHSFFDFVVTSKRTCSLTATASLIFNSLFSSVYWFQNVNAYNFCHLIHNGSKSFLSYPVG